MNRILKAVPWLFLLGLAAWGIHAWRAQHEIKPEDKFVTVKLERGDIFQTVSANGTLNPVVLVNVGTQVSGTVKKLYADFNDKVSDGQLLLELDPALYQAQVKISEANLANADAAIELAESTLSRKRDLVAKRYIPALEIDQAVRELKAAKAQRALAAAQLDKDRTNYRYSIIRAPVSGVVVSREVSVGQTVAANFQTPILFKIAENLRRMQIDTNFAEADIGQLRIGQTVTFTVDAFPTQTFKGEIKQIRLNPIVQQNVVTYNVVILVDNPDEILLPGMTAYVNAVVAEKHDVLRIPNAALRFRPSDDKPDFGRDAIETQRAYILRQGKPESVTLATGITDKRFSEVTGGKLAQGDSVIVEEKTEGGAPGQSSKAFRSRMF